jgi:hypothetical protein
MKLFTCISAAFTAFAFAGLAPVMALAQSCGNYPLTPAQSDALQKAKLDVVVPEGEVPFVQRCDIDENGVIDMLDIRQIIDHRNQPASDPDDPKDWDGNGVINVLDARGCVVACTNRRCAPSGPDKVQVRAAQAAAQNTVGQPGACYQVGDFDGDGKQDFIGIFEYVGNQTRGNNWNLQTVILYEDAAGDTQVIAFPYTGQSSRDGSQIFQHVSLQPAGAVDLMPGKVVLTWPGVVSYRNNEPQTLYYFENGVLSRAYYNIDD